MFFSSQILGARPRIVHGLVASVVALTAVLAGCGQTGALYMPASPAARRAAPPAPAPAPAALPATPASAAR